MGESTVTIEAGRYLELLQTEWRMTALEAAGVDNWEWYADAIRDMKDSVPYPGTEDR